MIRRFTLRFNVVGKCSSLHGLLLGESNVTQYDRYILSSLLRMFGLFALVLVGVYWVNHAVSLFDQLIAGGHSILVFFELSALGLPSLIRIVLPIAGFAAAVYVTNRLSEESELTVMQAIGSSPWRIARPVLVFGLLVGSMMMILSHVLLPAALAQLKLREMEISQYSSTRLLTEGAFLHPTSGITFFIHTIEDDGTLKNIFLSDRRNDAEVVTYTALEAFLFRKDDATTLLMFDGLIQRLQIEDAELTTTSFENFSYDISSLLATKAQRKRTIRELSSQELMFDHGQIEQFEGFSKGSLLEELHQRFSRALVCIAAAMIGFSALQLGSFSRFVIWHRVALGVILLGIMEALRAPSSAPVIDHPELWPLIYAPALLGIAASTLLLWLSAHPDLVLRTTGPTVKQQ